MTDIMTRDELEKAGYKIRVVLRGGIVDCKVTMPIGKEKVALQHAMRLATNDKGQGEYECRKIATAHYLEHQELEALRKSIAYINKLCRSELGAKYKLNMIAAYAGEIAHDTEEERTQ